MRPRRIILFLTTLVLICAYFGVSMTGAWFVSGGTLGGADYETAKVTYLPSINPPPEELAIYGKLIPGNTDTEEVLLLPGKEVLAGTPNGENITYLPLSIENFSTVSTNVRFKFDCNIEDKNTESGETVRIEGLYWKSFGKGRYQYGKDADVNIGGTTHSVFMGLLEVQFNIDAAYSWDFVKETPQTNPGVDQVIFGEYWNLHLAGGVAEIPKKIGEQRQQYNVITSIKIIGESENPDEQKAFDTFFSNNYAGMTMQINLNYYAKQKEYMQWQQFTTTSLNAGIS